MRCESCLSDLPKGARYCSHCGLAVAFRADDSISGGHMRGGAGAVPSEQTPQSPPNRSFEAQRRVATVMFADISGFTSFSETADPEHLRDLINSCFHQLAPIILDHGGQIDKFIGDEIMALFGATQANEDDAIRALDTARRMLAAIKDFSRANHVSWNLHIGINTGLVVTGLVGSATKQEFSVIGDTVNVAARLAGQAQPGEILVGEKTYQLARGRFALEPIPEVNLKGKSTPVNVYRLTGMRQAAETESAASTLRAPLLGREQEVALLTGLLRDLETGQSFILWISGEAGVGKSRLLAEVRTASPLRWIEGKAVPMGRSISYWPFIQILREYFEIVDAGAEEEAAKQITTRIRSLFPEDHLEIAPYLAHLLSIHVQDGETNRLEQMSAENLRFHIYKSIHRFFRRVARQNPIVLVFEDVHWADQSTLDLIEHLASLLKDARIGLMLIERSEETAITLQLKQHLHERFKNMIHVLKLPPLSDDVSRRLCESLLHVEEFKLAPVIEMVIGRSEGNPFFLEEMLKALIDMNVLVYDSRTANWNVEGERVQIPESLSAVVLARLDRMEDGVRDIVKYASVVGRSFLYKILFEMIKDRNTLESNLNKLLQIEIIREKLNRLDREYIFKHALFQKITYESILKQERKALHRHVGRIIEILFEERLEEFYGLLAYHYTQSEEWEKAHAYLLKAGERAERIGADTEALELYHQTLTAYQRAFGEQLDPFDAAVLQRKMGEALFRKGQHHLAEEYLLRALEFHGKKPPSGRRAIRTAIFKNALRQVLSRIGSIRTHIAPENDTPPSVLEIFQIRQTLGFIYFFVNRERYLLNILSGLSESEKNRYDRGLLSSFLGTGVVLDVMGFFALADKYFALASTIPKRNEHDQGMFFHLAGYHADCRCQWQRADQFYTKAIDHYQHAGEVKLWASASCLKVEIDVLQGSNPAHAAKRAQQVYDMGMEVGDRQLIAWGLCSQGLVLMHQERITEAVDYLEEANTLLTSIPDYYILLCSCCHLLDCCLMQGNSTQAADVMDKVEALIRTHGLVGPFVARFHVKKAEVLVHRYAREKKPKDRKLAGSACRKAIRRTKTFRAYLPEAYFSLAKLKSLDRQWGHERLRRKGLALAQAQGNHLALKRHGDIFDPDAA